MVKSASVFAINHALITFDEFSGVNFPILDDLRAFVILLTYSIDNKFIIDIPLTKTEASMHERCDLDL